MSHAPNLASNVILSTMENHFIYKRSLDLVECAEICPETIRLFKSLALQLLCNSYVALRHETYDKFAEHLLKEVWRPCFTE